MSEVIEREAFVKNFICERDTYLQLKADQKALVQEFYSKELIQAHEAAMQKWWDSRYVERKTFMGSIVKDERPGWKAEKPQEPWTVYQASLPWTRRAMNIVYGIVKGKKYAQIENKVKEDNEPPEHLIIHCCEHYGIDSSLILEALHG